MLGRVVLWTDGCFEIEDDDSSYWVTEILHATAIRRHDVPKQWRIKLSSLENAQRFIAGRLRDSHDDMYHFHAQQAVGQ